MRGGLVMLTHSKVIVINFSWPVVKVFLTVTKWNGCILAVKSSSFAKLRTLCDDVFLMLPWWRWRLFVLIATNHSVAGYDYGDESSRLNDIFHELLAGKQILSTFFLAKFRLAGRIFVVFARINHLVLQMFLYICSFRLSEPHLPFPSAVLIIILYRIIEVRINCRLNYLILAFSLDE